MGYIERYLSNRYLFSGRKGALLSAISLIAVSGVAIGVAALIIVIGVMDGAEKDLFGKILSIFPHVKIQSATGAELQKPDEVIAALKKNSQVVFAEPVINKQALFSGGLGERGELVAGQIISLSPTGGQQIYGFNEATNRKVQKLADQEILLGTPLAKKLGVKEGDQVLAITGLITKNTNRQKPSVRLKVAGTFDSGFYSFDSLASFVSPQTAASSFGEGQAVDYIHVKVHDPIAVNGWRRTFKINDLQTEIQIDLGGNYHVSSWLDDKGAFHQSLMLQKLALFLILMLIVMVAGFNIICTLIILVIEKTREVGLLKAIGASERMIRRTFLRVGSTIGLMGTGLGVVIGLFGCFLLKYVIKFKMPPAVYDFDRLPVTVKPLTVLVIIVAAMVVCIIAAFLPAIQAARLDPVESLRHE